MNPRVKPTQALGLLIGLGYPVMFLGIAGVLGASFADMSTGAKVQPFFISLVVSTVVLAVLTTVLGWWPWVLRDRAKVTSGVVRAVPVIWVITVAFMLIAGQGWTMADTDRLLFLVGLGIVGFTEEIVYRGLVLVGFRGQVSEQRAWLFATLLFVLLHVPNVLLGSAPQAVAVQCVNAFLAGTGLYMIRRATGGIILPMILHGLWDVSTFITQNPLASLVALPVSILVFVLFLVSRKHLFGPDQENQLDLEGTSTPAGATAAA